jgi:hypothetical protein
VCVCSKCGGFAIHRLNTVQLRYWRAVHEVYPASKAIEEHEQHLAGGCESGRDSDRCDRTSALQPLRRVGAVLDSYEDDPALTEYVKDLRGRHEGLARSAGMRL